MKIIDPHLHLFNLEQGQYHWLTKQNLNHINNNQRFIRSFSQSDLTLDDDLTLSGFVHIEAGFDNEQPWREIEWLESEVTLPFKSIGCIDLAASVEEFKANLAQLAGYNSVIGVRHILDEHAESILSMADINEKFQLLAQQGLIFELQMPISNLVATDLLILLVAQHPQVKVMVNHCGLPPKDINSELGYDWLLALHRLSGYPNIAIKCSGWEMIAPDGDFLWPVEIVQHCIQNFGENRVMLASNFPLCLGNHSYHQQWQMSLGLSQQQKQKLYCDNAKTWYQFE